MQIMYYYIMDIIANKTYNSYSSKVLGLLVESNILYIFIYLL